MATSTNYGWAEPDNSSLVKNGASDIRTLGNAIDTSVWNVGFGQAGKNKIINGDFNINQRAFTSNTGNSTYNFDRFIQTNNGGTATVTTQTFTLGTAPVAGYEAKNFLQYVTSGQSAAGDYAAVSQKIESVRTLANQTATISFWAKTSSGTPKTSVSLQQNFGTGGSPSATVITKLAPFTISTSWARYSVTTTVPSISGKTLGTVGDSLNVDIWASAGTGLSLYSDIGIQNATIQIWGVQIEAGSTATPFQTASGGSSQAELAMCQRYYWRSTPGTNYGGHGTYGSARTTTVVKAGIPFPVQMRVIPTSIDYSTLAVNDGQTIIAVTAVAFSAYESQLVAYPEFTVGSASLTQYRPYHVNNNNNTAAYLGFSAEL